MLTGAILNIPHVMEDSSYEENECILYRPVRLSKEFTCYFLSFIKNYVWYTLGKGSHNTVLREQNLHLYCSM